MTAARGRAWHLAEASQREIYEALRARHLPAPMSTCILPRVLACRSLVTSSRVDMDVIVRSVEARIRSLARSSGIVALDCLRAWSNAWATAEFMQKGSAPPCVWSCFPAGRDSLAHMLVCPHLWGAIEFVMGCSFAHPEDRKALRQAEPVRCGGPPFSVLGLSLAVQAYHRLREGPAQSPEAGRRQAHREVVAARRLQWRRSRPQARRSDPRSPRGRRRPPSPPSRRRAARGA